MSKKGYQFHGNGSKIGVTYQLQGVDSIDEYPEDDMNIEIVGVVAVDENDVRYLDVPAENLKTV